MDKVIITGATGFIGRHAVPLLKCHGFDVHAVTSKQVPPNISDDITWHLVNIFDYERVNALCREIGASHLLHLAWHDVPGERMTSPQNLAWVEASLQLVRKFSENGGRRIVLAGSCAEYDWEYGYCNEKITPIEPASLYGECKASLNRILMKYCLAQGLEYACGRIFFVYGPHESEERFVPYLINSLLAEQKAKILHGNIIRDYMHVSDVANAMVKLLVSRVQGPVNIASGVPHSLQEIGVLISRKLLKPGFIDYGSKEDSDDTAPVLFAGVSRLRDELNWRPKYNVSRGMDDTIRWWKNKQKVNALINQQ